MVDLDMLMQTYDETQKGCDHKCESCDMYLPARDECFHIANKRWKEWNEKEHDRFGQLLKGER